MMPRKWFASGRLLRQFANRNRCIGKSNRKLPFLLFQQRNDRMKSRVAFLLVCTFALCGTAAAQKPEFIKSSGATPQTPFSEAVRVGNLLYLSGQIGIAPGTTSLVPGGISAETRQTLENIKATIERAGGSMDNVAKCLVMLADMS